MTDQKKDIHGGNEDGIGIAKGIEKSSEKTDASDRVTSNAGKILEKGSDLRTRHE